MSDVSPRKFAGQQTASGIDRRNLRGRCGGFDGRRAQAPSHDRPSRFGRLPRQGQAPQYEADTKGACPSLATPPSIREGPRDEEPDCRATNAAGRQPPCAGFPEGRKHPGCRDGAPLRGGRRDGDLDRRVTRKGSPTFQTTRDATVTKGCSTSREEGSHLSPFAGTAYEREGRSFARGSSARTRTSLSFQPSSAQPTVGFSESPRTRRREERQSLALQPQAVLHRFEEGVTGVVRLAARPLSKGKGAIARLERPTSGRGKRGLSQRCRVETPSPPEARKRGVGRSRSCSREWLRRTRRSERRSRSRWLVVWRKEAGALHPKRVGSVRGQASSVRSAVRERGRQGVKGHQGWVEAETLT